MDALDAYAQRYLWLAAKLEQYIVEGVFEDMLNYNITDKDGEDIFRLGRFQTDMPGLFNRWLRPVEENDSMALNKLILFKDKGHSVPMDVIEAACNTFNKYSARCVIMDGEIMSMKEDAPPKAGIIQPETEDFLSYYEILVLGNESLKENDIQPFPVIVDGDKILVVGFLQGDVSVIPNIVKKVQKIHMGSGGSFEEFVKDLKETDDILKMLPENSCAIFFMPSIDEDGKPDAMVIEFPSTFANVFEWGASYTIAAPADGGTKVEETVVQPADAPKKPAFRSSAVSQEVHERVAARTTETQTNRVQPSGVPMAKVRPNEKSKIKQDLRGHVNESGVLVFKDKKESFVRCPQMVPNGEGGTRKIHRDENHMWHEKHLGWIPENAMDWPLIPVSFLIIPVNIAELQSSASPAALATRDIEPKPPLVSMKPDKTALNHYEALLIKVHGTNTEQIENPANMFKDVESIDFFKLIGKDNNWIGLAWVGLYTLMKSDPENGARHAMAFQYLAHNLRVRCSELEANVQKLEEELAAAKPKKPSFSSTR